MKAFCLWLKDADNSALSGLLSILLVTCGTTEKEPPCWLYHSCSTGGRKTQAMEQATQVAIFLSDLERRGLACLRSCTLFMLQPSTVARRPFSCSTVLSLSELILMSPARPPCWDAPETIAAQVGVGCRRLLSDVLILCHKPITVVHTYSLCP